MSIDDDIRAALDGFAQLAPHPERVRSTLQARIRRHRQRRMLLTVGTVAAGAAAVGVPAYLLLRSTKSSPPPSNLPTPLPEPSPGGTNLHATMLLRPTWLPEGLTEISREGRTGEEFQLRLWASKEYAEAVLAEDMERAGEAAMMALRVDPRPVEPVGGGTYPPESPPPPGPFLPLGHEPNTTVGPHPAYLGGVNDGVVEGAGVHLTWQLDDGRLAEVTLKAPDAVNAAMRIALSVVPDTTAGVEVGFSFGWLPDPVLATPARLEVYGLNGDWVQYVEVNALEYGPSVRANLRSKANLGGGSTDARAVTVRGRPGQVINGEVLVQLENGHWLGVVAPDEASSIRVANGIVIGPEAYRGWIGTR